MLTSQNRAQKLLAFLAELTVNGSQVAGQIGLPKLTSEPAIPTIYESPDGPAIDVDNVLPPKGWRDVLLEKGPEGFAKAVRDFKGTLIMDTTWRDAHQSLLATRVRTYDLLKIALLLPMLLLVHLPLSAGVVLL